MTWATNPGNGTLPGHGSEIAAAWAARSDELAAWAWNNLVVRTDAWGGYWDREFRRRDGTLIKPGDPTTRKGQLTPAVLIRHFWARNRADVMGLHSTSSLGLCRCGAIDIDWHGPTSTSPEVNCRAALAWYEQLVDRGFHPLLLDSNGAGGFHLRILLDRPAPAARVYHFLQLLISDHAKHGMQAPPETFPRQAVLSPSRDGRPSYGNWLRLPGRHHSRDWWSEVWCGTHWLAGHQAVDLLLALPINSVDLLPAIPPPRPVPQRPCVVRVAGGDRRAAAYMARLPHRGAGQGRDNVAYGAACFLVRTLTLADDQAFAWLTQWDAGNNPPKGSEQLWKVINNAHTYGRNPIGCGKPHPMGLYS